MNKRRQAFQLFEYDGNGIYGIIEVYDLFFFFFFFWARIFTSNIYIFSTNFSHFDFLVYFLVVIVYYLSPFFTTDVHYIHLHVDIPGLRIYGGYETRFWIVWTFSFSTLGWSVVCLARSVGWARV